MNDSIKAEGRAFAEFLKSLPESERIKGNELERRRAEEEFKQFQEEYDKGCCYLCNKPLTSFSKKLPCIHWLLKPKGFKKKDIKLVASVYGFFQIQSYLRWFANQAGFARNINDMPEGGTGKLFEVTIRYRNLEWSFSCAEGDYNGHDTSQHGQQPHYHFQMRVDKKPFIDFGDFHIPFSKMDVINIEAMRAQPNLIKQRHSFGEGMKDVLRDDTVEQIINVTVPDGYNSEEAPFKIDTIAIAEDGKTIKGDDVYNLIQEAKAKGVTVASLMHKLPNAQARIIVSPGPGVVEQAPRSKRKKDK